MFIKEREILLLLLLELLELLLELLLLKCTNYEAQHKIYCIQVFYPLQKRVLNIVMK